MKDNRKLDMLIAEKVMGFEKRLMPFDHFDHEVWGFYKDDKLVYAIDAYGGHPVCHVNGKDRTDGTTKWVPYFSRDVEDTIPLLDLLKKVGPVISYENNMWTISYRVLGGKDSVTCENLSRAICLAALRSLGSKI